MALLLDFYGELLTEKQKEYLDLYYNEDFSLAEIARPRGITPQGVRDLTRRGEGILRDTETKTGLLARFTQISGTAGEIREKLQRIEARTGDETLTPLFQEIYRDLETLDLG